jgi:hypothetical protein
MVDAALQAFDICGVNEKLGTVRFKEAYRV